MKFKNILSIDTQKMYKIYDQWPEIARESYETEQEKFKFKNLKQIIFMGMGGSGSIGDVFAAILSKSKIHVKVVKGYVLPSTIDKNTLVVIISVSGNTNESLTVLKNAMKIGAKIIVFASGGKISEYCKKKKVNFKKIQSIHSPRASFTSYLYTILKLLHETLEIRESEILESINELNKMKKNISSSNLTKNNLALNLAEWITEIPVVYYPYGLQSSAIRFKNSLQENAKMHVFTEDIIEACHNGIVSWERKSNIKPILIEGQDDHIKTKERWKILKEFFNENNIDYQEVISIKGSILSKIINLIYFLDYVTIYKAILDGIDPSPVKSIDHIKSKLSIKTQK